MRTSVILNLKGGVAKTATAVNMAAILMSRYTGRRWRQKWEQVLWMFGASLLLACLIGLAAVISVRR